MITMTVYVSDGGFCRIKDNLLGSLYTEEIIGTIEPTGKTPYEIQVPIEVVSNVSQEDNKIVLYFDTSAY